MINIIIHVCLWLTILFFVCVYVCVIMSRWLYILDADWELGDDKVSETDLRRHLPAIDCRVSKINCWEVQGLIDVLFWWLSKIYLNKIEHLRLSSVGGSDISNGCWAVGCLNGTFSAPWFHFSLRWGLGLESYLDSLPMGRCLRPAAGCAIPVPCCTLHRLLTMGASHVWRSLNFKLCVHGSRGLKLHKFGRGAWLLCDSQLAGQVPWQSPNCPALPFD